MSFAGSVRFALPSFFPRISARGASSPLAEPYLYSGGSKLLTGVLGLAHRLPGPFKTVWQVYVQKSA